MRTISNCKRINNDNNNKILSVMCMKCFVQKWIVGHKMVETRTQIRMWNIPFVGGHCLRTIKYASVLDVLLMDKVFRLLHLLFFFVAVDDLSFGVPLQWSFTSLCCGVMNCQSPLKKVYTLMAHTTRKKILYERAKRREDERTVFGVQLYSLGKMIICWKCFAQNVLWIYERFSGCARLKCIRRDVAISREQFNATRNQLPNIQFVLRCSCLRNRFQSVSNCSKWIRAFKSRSIANTGFSAI